MYIDTWFSDFRKERPATFCREVKMVGAHHALPEEKKSRVHFWILLVVLVVLVVGGVLMLRDAQKQARTDIQASTPASARMSADGVIRNLT